MSANEAVAVQTAAELNMHLYEPVSLGTSTGEDVELQPSPAYETTQYI